jgi:hypothetical protein
MAWSSVRAFLFAVVLRERPNALPESAKHLMLERAVGDADRVLTPTPQTLAKSTLGSCARS